MKKRLTYYNRNMSFNLINLNGKELLDKVFQFCQTCSAESVKSAESEHKNEAMMKQ